MWASKTNQSPAAWAATKKAPALPINDVGGYFAVKNVEAALAELGTSRAQGAPGVTVTDSAANFPEAAKTVEAVLAAIAAREYGESVLKHGADKTGATESTAAFLAAQAASPVVIVPPGTYLLDGFRQHSGVTFIGCGWPTIVQKSAGTPAWDIFSDASTGQLIDCVLHGFRFVGHAAATVRSVRIKATTPYVVQNADIDIRGVSGFGTLTVDVTAALEFYASRVKVVQTASVDTGCVLSGVYNQYFMHIAGAQNGIGFIDSGWSSVYTQAVTEGSQIITGQDAVILNATVESWVGAAQTAALQYLGINPTILAATLINVPAASASIGLALNAGGGGPFYLNNFRIIGANHPTYPMDIQAGNTGVIANALVSTTIPLEAYVPAAVMRGITFAGDCSTLSGWGKLAQRGISTNRGDNSVTLTAGTDYENQLFATALTANRTVTLSTISAAVGDTFTIVRTGLGAFTLSVNGLYLMPANTAGWCTVVYDGANWQITARGAFA